MAIDDASAALQLSGVLGALCAQVAYQLAVTRTDKPSAPVAVGSQQTADGEYYYSPADFALSAATPGNSYIRFGVAHDLSVGPNRGVGDFLLSWTESIVSDFFLATPRPSVRPRRSRSRAAEEGFPRLLRTLLALGVPCLLLAAGPDGARSLTEHSAATCRPVSEQARREQFVRDLSYQYAPPEDRALVSAIGDLNDALSFSHALDCAAAWTRLGSLRSVNEPVELPHLPLLLQPGDWWADPEPLKVEDVFRHPKPAHIEAYIQVYAAEKSAMVMLFRGDSFAALRRLDAVSGLDADTTYPGSSQPTLPSVKIAALRGFILGGGTLGCGVPIVPREPARPPESRSEPVERVVVPHRSHAEEAGRGDISPAGEAFMAAATGAYASYTEACAAGWREYDRALVECSINTIVISDAGVLDALSDARDAEAALRPRDRRKPEVLWSSAVLAAASHDTPRAHVLLQQLASGRWGASVADNASAFDAWLTVAGGLDCNLPFVASGDARSAAAE